jgi:hypothetical protein
VPIELRSLSLADYQVAGAVRALLALLAVVVLTWWWYEERRSSPRWRRLRTNALISVGVLSFLSWWNIGWLPFSPRSFHAHEFFHYYLGAKYFSELGYTGLYDCSAAVEMEAGRASQVADLWIRDLRTNELRRGPVNLERALECRARFSSAARWADFTHDALWFRERMGEAKRIEILTDHGFNATPVWIVAGRALTSLGPASSGQVHLLMALDPVLLVLLVGIAWWAFGWQAACVAIVWWGTNFPGRFTYTGGALLRQDWLLLAVAGICFAKKRLMAASGFALTWSALLRIFPGFILVGLALKVLVGMWRARSLRLAPEYWRFAAGAVLALVLLVPPSLVVGGENYGGLNAWRAFVQNSQKHVSSPFTNAMGLPFVLATDSSSRAQNISAYWLDSPWDTWKDARRRVFAERRLLYFALVGGFLLLLAAAVHAQDNWLALTLGLGTLPLFADLSCYYYTVFLGFGFLWTRHRLMGVGLALAAFLTAITPALLQWEDDRYLLLSAIVLSYVVAVTAAFAWRDRRRPEPVTDARPESASTVQLLTS